MYPALLSKERREAALYSLFCFSELNERFGDSVDFFFLLRIYQNFLNLMSTISQNVSVVKIVSAVLWPEAMEERLRRFQEKAGIDSTTI